MLVNIVPKKLSLFLLTGILHKVHSLGKMGNNMFSNVTKPTESASVTNNHQVAGLKRDLIRLAGNMVYRNVANQDLVRRIIVFCS